MCGLLRAQCRNAYVSAAPGSLQGPRGRIRTHDLLLTVAVGCDLLHRGVELLFLTYCIAIAGWCFGTYMGLRPIRNMSFYKFWKIGEKGEKGEQQLLKSDTIRIATSTQCASANRSPSPTQPVRHRVQVQK